MARQVTEDQHLWPVHGPEQHVAACHRKAREGKVCIYLLIPPNQPIPEPFPAVRSAGHHEPSDQVQCYPAFAARAVIVVPEIPPQYTQNDFLQSRMFLESSQPQGATSWSYHSLTALQDRQTHQS